MLDHDIAQRHEQCRRARHEHVGTQSSRLVFDLPLKPDGGAQQHRQANIGQDLKLYLVKLDELHKNLILRFILRVFYLS